MKANIMGVQAQQFNTSTSDKYSSQSSVQLAQDPNTTTDPCAEYYGRYISIQHCVTQISIIKSTTTIILEDNDSRHRPQDSNTVTFPSFYMIYIHSKLGLSCAKLRPAQASQPLTSDQLKLATHQLQKYILDKFS